MTSRSNSNAAATQAQRKATTSDNKRTSSPPSTSKLLGLASTDPGKRPLLHTDSGYISPTVAPTSNGSSPQTPSGRGLQNAAANFQIGGTPVQISSQSAEDPSKPATEQTDPSSESESLVSEHNITNRTADDINMQSVLPPRESHTATQYNGLRSLPTETVSVSTACMTINYSSFCCLYLTTPEVNVYSVKYCGNLSLRVNDCQLMH